MTNIILAEVTTINITGKPIGPHRNKRINSSPARGPKKNSFTDAMAKAEAHNSNSAQSIQEKSNGRYVENAFSRTASDDEHNGDNTNGQLNKQSGLASSSTEIKERQLEASLVTGREDLSRERLRVGSDTGREDLSREELRVGSDTGREDLSREALRVGSDTGREAFKASSDKVHEEGIKPADSSGTDIKQGSISAVQSASRGSTHAIEKIHELSALIDRLSSSTDNKTNQWTVNVLNHLSGVNDITLIKSAVQGWTIDINLRAASLSNAQSNDLQDLWANLQKKGHKLNELSVKQDDSEQTS